MARFLLLWLILVADTCVVLAMAHESTAGVPLIRKLGKHHSRLVRSSGALDFSPSPAPESEEKNRSTKETGSSPDQTAVFEPKDEVENRTVEGEKVLVKKQHHSMDKSVAGGGVILGGLATTFLVAVFCYIRATGRKNSEATPQLT